MADTDEPVFENDQQMEEYLISRERSECLSTSLDWSDAVGSFKKGTVDVIRPTPGSDKWSAYLLYPEFIKFRPAAHEITERLRAGIFRRSRA